MKSLKIKLLIDGKKKKFKAPKFVNSSIFSRTMELENDLENPQDYTMIFKKLYPLICDVFGNQFTSEQLQKGVDIREIIPLTHKAIDHVVDQMYLSNNKGG